MKLKSVRGYGGEDEGDSLKVREVDDDGLGGGGGGDQYQ